MTKESTDKLKKKVPPIAPKPQAWVNIPPPPPLEKIEDKPKIASGNIILLSQKNEEEGKGAFETLEFMHGVGHVYRSGGPGAREYKGIEQKFLDHISQNAHNMKVEYVDFVPKGFVGIAIEENNGKTTSMLHDGKTPYGISGFTISEEKSKEHIGIKDFTLEIARNAALSKTKGKNTIQDINTSFDILKDFRNGSYHTIMNHPEGPIGSLDRIARLLKKDNPQLADEMHTLKVTLQSIQQSKKVAEVKGKPTLSEPQIIKPKVYQKPPLAEDKKLSFFQKLTREAGKLVEFISPQRRMKRINPEGVVSQSNRNSKEVAAELNASRSRD